MYAIIVTFWIAWELLKVIVSSSDIFGNFQKSSENHRKSLEIDRTFSEIQAMTRGKSHTFSSEKVGRCINDSRFLILFHGHD